jgi:uncharacterized damage-inducible protein DinB
MQRVQAKPIVELYRHNLWANLRIIDACDGLSEEQLKRSVEGTYGSIADTLVHLFASEERYVSQLPRGTPPRDPLHETRPFPGLALLRRRARRSGEALIDFAERVRPQQMLRGVYRGRSYAMSVSAPLVQAINHATEHRTQIATMLTQSGVTPPDTDGWAYVRVTGLMRFNDEH